MDKAEFLNSPCVDNCDLGDHAVRVSGVKPGEVYLSALYPDGIAMSVECGVLSEVSGKCHALKVVGPKAAGYWLDERRKEIEAERDERSKAYEDEPCRSEELNALMLPWAQLKGNVVTRAMVKQMADAYKWKKGGAYKVARKALEGSDAKWFLMEHAEGDWSKPETLWPITSAFVAKSNGIRDYKIPVMPKHYRNKCLSRVAGHEFTYEEFYQEWTGLLRKIISSRTEDTLKYPYLLTAQIYYGDIPSDEVSVTDFAGFVKAVERADGNEVTFDVMWNDPWGNTSEPSGFGFRVTETEIVP